MPPGEAKPPQSLRINPEAVKRGVSTAKKPGETAEEFKARHERDVAIKINGGVRPGEAAQIADEAIARSREASAAAQKSSSDTESLLEEIRQRSTKPAEPPRQTAELAGIKVHSRQRANEQPATNIGSEPSHASGPSAEPEYYERPERVAEMTPDEQREYFSVVQPPGGFHNQLDNVAADGNVYRTNMMTGEEDQIFDPATRTFIDLDQATVGTLDDGQELFAQSRHDVEDSFSSPSRSRDLSRSHEPSRSRRERHGTLKKIKEKLGKPFHREKKLKPGVSKVETLVSSANGSVERMTYVTPAGESVDITLISTAEGRQGSSLRESVAVQGVESHIGAWKKRAESLQQQISDLDSEYDMLQGEKGRAEDRKILWRNKPNLKVVGEIEHDLEQIEAERTRAYQQLEAGVDVVAFTREDNLEHVVYPASAVDKKTGIDLNEYSAAVYQNIEAYESARTEIESVFGTPRLDESDPSSPSLIHPNTLSVEVAHTITAAELEKLGYVPKTKSVPPEVNIPFVLKDDAVREVGLKAAEENNVGALKKSLGEGVREFFLGTGRQEKELAVAWGRYLTSVSSSNPNEVGIYNPQEIERVLANMAKPSLHVSARERFGEGGVEAESIDFTTPIKNSGWLNEINIRDGLRDKFYAGEMKTPQSIEQALPEVVGPRAAAAVQINAEQGISSIVFLDDAEAKVFKREMQMPEGRLAKLKRSLRERVVQVLK